MRLWLQAKDEQAKAMKKRRAQGRVVSTSATQAIYWAQASIEQVLLGQQHRGRRNHRILEDTEVIPDYVADVVILICAKVWLPPDCAKPPIGMRAKKEKLLPPTMNGGGKTLEEDTLRSWAETPPTFGLRIPPQNKKSPEQGNTRSNLVEETKDTKGENHPNGVRGQLRRDYIIEPKQTPDKLWDWKPETSPQSVLIDC